MTNLSGTNLNNGVAVGPQGEGMDSPSTFPKYPAYKDSGVEWLGDVPEHWGVKQLRYLGRFRKGLTITKADLADTGIPCLNYGEVHSLYPFEVNQDIQPLKSVPVEYLETDPSACVKYGDFVFADTSEDLDGVGNFTLVSGMGSLFSGYHTIIYSPDSEVSSRFLAYCLDSFAFRTQLRMGVKGVKVFSVTQEILRGGTAWLPTTAEQTQIARFLDHETARIDALIEDQQRLIELLKEKRQAVISHAVTKGLDPAVPMKDSGVEWLGEVPQHWQVGALGYFAGIDTGATPDRGNPEYWGGDIPWIKTGEVNYENISQAEEHITREGVKNSAAKVAPKGTLLMAMYGQGVTRGRVAILDIEAAYNQACAGIFVDSRIRVEYLRLFFIAAYPYIRDGGNETSQMNLSSGHIAKIKITVPPISEQISAEHFLNTEMARFDSLINEAGLLANNLQERRSALISAAVTGKIDVRGWQPPVSIQAPKFEVAEAN